MLPIGNQPSEWFELYPRSDENQSVTLLTLEAFLTDTALPRASSYKIASVLRGFELQGSTDPEVVDRVVSLLSLTTHMRNPFAYIDSYLADRLAEVGVTSLGGLAPRDRRGYHGQYAEVLSAFGTVLTDEEARQLEQFVNTEVGGFTDRRRPTFYIERANFLASGMNVLTDPVPGSASISMLEVVLCATHGEPQAERAAALMESAVATLDEEIVEFATDVLFESKLVPFRLVEVFARKMAEVTNPYVVLDVLGRYTLYLGMTPADLVAFETLTEEELRALVQLGTKEHPWVFSQAIAEVRD